MKIYYFCKLLFEAFIVALSIVILGFGIQKVFKLNDPLKLLFVTGFLVHVLYDLVGFNKYYCKICAGCK
tara:strand:- start:180 stop:386 length:207 start_codon:yes stop_codon:yes gene_type:complete